MHAVSEHRFELPTVREIWPPPSSEQSASLGAAEHRPARRDPDLDAPRPRGQDADAEATSWEAW